MAMFLNKGKNGRGQKRIVADPYSAQKWYVPNLLFDSLNLFFSEYPTGPKLRNLKNGKKISGRGDFGKGSPMIPMSYDEVADKFLGCCEFAKWPSKKSKALIELVRNLEKVKDISKLSKLLSK